MDTFLKEAIESYSFLYFEKVSSPKRKNLFHLDYTPLRKRLFVQEIK